MAQPVPWKRIVAEFVAIAAGVFLALLGDDYREQRDERRTEQEYLRLLERDLERDQAELEFIRGISDQVEGAHVLRHLRRATTIPRDSVERALSALTLSWSYDQPRPTFLSIRDVGGLSTIRNSTLRSDLIDYYEVWQVRLQSWFTNYIPWQRQLRRDLDEYVEVWPLDEFDSFVVDPLPDDFLELAVPWESLANDRELWYSIVEVGVRAAEIHGLVLEVLARNAELQSSIGDEIG